MLDGRSEGIARPPELSQRWWIDALWLILFCAGSAYWCLTAATRVGVTYDEPFYLNYGLESWRKWSCHDLALNGVMPLPIDAVTLPLYAHEKWTGSKIDDPMSHLHWARMVTIGWVWLLLLSALRLGRAVGGPWAGRIAAGLIAADPNFLAHSSLATTDISVTAILMAFTRAVYVGRSGGWWKRLLLPGMWYGIAVLAKLSALLYGGLILVGLEIAYRFAAGHLARPAGASLTAWGRQIAGMVVRSVLAVATVIAIGILIAGLYCWIPELGVRPFSTVARDMPPGEPLKARYLELAAKVDQVPYALVTFSFQWWHNSQGRPTFLNGTYYATGSWFYFPVLLAMKLPLTIILLGLIALTRPRAVWNPLTLITGLLFLSSLVANLQIGLRLVLPVMAIGYVAVAVAVIRGLGRWGIRAGFSAIMVLAATSIWVWPHGLCFLNQLSGGLAAAPERVCDSNCDWGQGIPDLAAWRRDNGEPPLVVWYFGTDSAVDRPPFQRIPVESLPLTSGKDLQAAVGPRILAVGTTVITLHPDGPPAKVAALEYLRSRVPLARTPTFILYDFRDPAGPPPRH